MDELKITKEAALRAMSISPDVKAFLLTLFPELKKTTRVSECTDASFSPVGELRGEVLGHSHEGLLTRGFLLGHRFTKITFEYEE